jgi:hypothetical protein
VVQRFDFGGLDMAVKNLEAQNQNLTPPEYKPDCSMSWTKTGITASRPAKGFMITRTGARPRFTGEGPPAHCHAQVFEGPGRIGYPPHQ